MKRTHKIIAGLVLAAGIGSTAYAQGSWGCNGSGPMGLGGMGGMGPMGRQAAAKFDPAQRAAQHLDYMKYQLKITPEQEPLWRSFADKAQGEAGKGRAAMQAQADANLPAPERMAKMQGLMEERLAAMKGVNESFGRLYAALTPEQKKIADQQAARMGKGGMGGMGGMGGRPGRMGPPVAPQG
jgi:hypothetical protein